MGKQHIFDRIAHAQPSARRFWRRLDSRQVPGFGRTRSGNDTEQYAGQRPEQVFSAIKAAFVRP